VSANVDDLGQGVGGRPSTGRPVQKQIVFGQIQIFWRFGSTYWSPTPPPLSTGARIAIYLTFRTFLRWIRSGHPRWGGPRWGDAKRTMLDRGGSKKSVFPRMSDG